MIRDHEAARRRGALARALERLEDLREKLIAKLDEIEGDPDFEDQCEDEGAQCEDEGEIDHGTVSTYFGDGIDQRMLCSPWAGKIEARVR